MTKTLQVTLFLILTLITASHASAQDVKYFSKLYLGGEIGYLDIGTDDGFVGGLFLGGSYQTDGDIVLGVEIGGLGTTSDQNDFGLLSITGTVGLVTGDDKRNLFYIGGGFEGAIGLDDVEDSFFQDDNGFSIVGGYERALHEHIALRLQAKYLNFGDGFGDLVNSDGIAVTAGISVNF
jgi:opacity protein-like surface antigen